MEDILDNDAKTSRTEWRDESWKGIDWSETLRDAKAPFVASSFYLF